MTSKLVSISKLKGNNGQIEGLPKNPRLIKDSKFEKLKQSIIDDPEMLDLREVVAYDNNGELVLILGNQRLKACKELGFKEVPTKILPKDTSIDKLKAYVIKDNVSSGDHDFDALNKWDNEDLNNWGIDIEVEDIFQEKPEKKTKEIKPYIKSHILLSFPPEKFIELQPILNQLENFEYLEIEQASN